MLVLPDKTCYSKKTHTAPIWRLRFHGRKNFDFSIFKPKKIRQKSFRTKKKVLVIHPIIG